MSLDPWLPAPDQVQCRANEIHIWRAALHPTAEILQALAQTLSKDERARAARYRSTEARCAFVTGRGWLRLILSHYVGRAAATLAFDYGPQGKPYLATHELHFNLAHAQTLALYAITRDIDVGVDLEYTRGDIDIDIIAQHFFTEGERQNLYALPTQERREAFFALWTQKEAYLKACGTGLSQSLRAAPPQGWSVYTFTPQRDYVASLAIPPKNNVALHFFEVPGHTPGDNVPI